MRRSRVSTRAIGLVLGTQDKPKMRTKVLIENRVERWVDGSCPFKAFHI